MFGTWLQSCEHKTGIKESINWDRHRRGSSTSNLLPPSLPLPTPNYFLLMTAALKDLTLKTARHWVVNLILRIELSQVFSTPPSGVNFCHTPWATNFSLFSPCDCVNFHATCTIMSNLSLKHPTTLSTNKVCSVKTMGSSRSMEYDNGFFIDKMPYVTKMTHTILQ